MTRYLNRNRRGAGLPITVFYRVSERIGAHEIRKRNIVDGAIFIKGDRRTLRGLDFDDRQRITVHIRIIGEQIDVLDDLVLNTSDLIIHGKRSIIHRRHFDR